MSDATRKLQRSMSQPDKADMGSPAVRNRDDGVRQSYIIGRDSFARISAVEGILVAESSGYQLTKAELELIDRFETYKRSRGEELPKLGDLIEDDYERESSRSMLKLQGNGETGEDSSSLADEMDFLN